MTSWLKTTLPNVREIERRLVLLVPASVDPRGWASRTMAARTVYVLLYGLAIEGKARWLRPTAVTDMTDAQAAFLDFSERDSWLDRVQGRDRPREVPGRWYSENSREPIRDETLRTLVKLGLVVERPGLATSSSQPRYALAAAVLDIFEPEISDVELRRRVADWQLTHFSPSVRARATLVRRGATTSHAHEPIRLPNGEVRLLAPGPSAPLSRAVVEEFAPRFLREPAVLLVSESRTKLAVRDDELCRAIGFRIDPSRTLPDVILVDVSGPDSLLIFVECVATDGPVDERRKEELRALATAAEWPLDRLAFVTAFTDRADPPFRKTAAALAWGTCAWFASEPGSILVLADERIAIDAAAPLLRLMLAGTS